jgi:hypothetical protein
MKHSFLIFAALIFLMSGCNQTGLGAWNATKNLITSPINSVKNIFTDSSYENKKSKTEDNADKEESIRYCAGSDGSPITGDQLSEIEKLSDKVMATNCKCRPWGDCPTGVCACEKQCPNDFKIFQRPETQPIESLTRLENGLAFRNNSTPSNYAQTQGYCWGHANITAKFNRLSFFNPQKIPPHDIQSSSPTEQQKAIDYYKGLIDQIADNEATEIPGFRNLHQFSSHPALQSYFGDKVAKTWAKNAMSWQGLGTALTTKKQTDQNYERLFADVKSRLDMNLQPTIVFTYRSSSFHTHATLVSHYEMLPDGKMKLCLRDNNYREELNGLCNHSMQIDPTRGLLYQNKEIGGVKIAHNENADTLAQAESLKQKCMNQRDCENK